MPIDLLFLIIVIIASVLFAVTIHEAAHAYVAYRMGDNTAMRAGRLTLNPIKHLDLFGSVIIPLILLMPWALKLSRSFFIFGYAKPVPVNPSNFRDFKKGTIAVSAAGITANLVLALISGALFHVFLNILQFSNSFYYKPLFLLLGFSVLINSILAIFNLIPLPPLDGSRILAMFLPVHLRIPYMRIERFFMVIIIFLIITNVLGKFLSFFLPILMDIFMSNKALYVFSELLKEFWRS